MSGRAPSHRQRESQRLPRLRFWDGLAPRSPSVPCGCRAFLGCGVSLRWSIQSQCSRPRCPPRVLGLGLLSHSHGPLWLVGIDCLADWPPVSSCLLKQIPRSIVCLCIQSAPPTPQGRCDLCNQGARGVRGSVSACLPHTSCRGSWGPNLRPGLCACLLYIPSGNSSLRLTPQPEGVSYSF